MDLILLERVDNLGQIGDVVSVRAGYARNYLLPQKKALRANEENKKRFESQRADLEARNLERKAEAEAAATKMNGSTFTIIRQASETGLLYGSVSTRDIAEQASQDGLQIDRTQVRLDKPIKMLGVVSVRVRLHPEVDSTIEINVARTTEEAERQAAGEDIYATDDDKQNNEEDTSAEFFDAEAQEATDAEASSEDISGDEADETTE